MIRRHCLFFYLLVASVATCISLGASTVCRAAITIDTVPIGDPGNPNDPVTGNRYGGVGYAYNIGKYEVTVGQYVSFLNAVAVSDTYALYDARMASDLNIAGIAQSGASGSYNYSVIDSPNHPITYVSWGDAARFCNWLSNGQPTGAEGPGTTETGAYTLNGATSRNDLMAVVRNAGAKWVIPTENEWYKAAYYEPAAKGGDSDSYWDYPMKTNSTPFSDQPPGATPDNTRVGNYLQYDGLANGYNDGFAVTGSGYDSGQNYLTDVGAYAFSPSYYGTFDQGGNAFEWNERAVTIIARGVRGDSWLLAAGTASYSSSRDPSSQFSDVGFRVASIPEPRTGLLAVLACGLGCISRAMRQCWAIGGG
jgi:sulfatase modifying factor 1